MRPMSSTDRGEVVVDRDDVHAFARQRVEVRGVCRHERFALAGLHLGDVAQVERRAAHDLDVVGPFARWFAGRLRAVHSGESLGKELVKGFAVRDTPLNCSVCPRSSSSVMSSKVGPERIDLLFDRPSFFRVRPSPARRILLMNFPTGAVS